MATNRRNLNVILWVIQILPPIRKRHQSLFADKHLVCAESSHRL